MEELSLRMARLEHGTALSPPTNLKPYHAKQTPAQHTITAEDDVVHALTAIMVNTVQGNAKKSSKVVPVMTPPAPGPTLFPLSNRGHATLTPAPLTAQMTPLGDVTTPSLTIETQGEQSGGLEEPSVRRVAGGRSRSILLTPPVPVGVGGGGGGGNGGKTTVRMSPLPSMQTAPRCVPFASPDLSQSKLFSVIQTKKRQKRSLLRERRRLVSIVVDTEG